MLKEIHEQPETAALWVARHLPEAGPLVALPLDESVYEGVQRIQILACGTSRHAAQVGAYLLEQLVLEMARRGQLIAGSRVLVLGLVFKENCPDLRNTRLVDVIAALERCSIEPVLVDTWVYAEEARMDFGVKVLATLPINNRYGAVIAAVAHRQYVDIPEASWRELLLAEGVLLDLKGLMPRALQPLRL